MPLRASRPWVLAARTLPTSVYRGLQTTLQGTLTDQTKKIAASARLMYAFAGVAGGALFASAALYALAAGLSLLGRRYALSNTLVSLPTALLRGMASRRVKVGDGDDGSDDGSDDGLFGGGGGGGGGAAAAPPPPPALTFGGNGGSAAAAGPLLALPPPPATAKVAPEGGGVVPPASPDGGAMIALYVDAGAGAPAGGAMVAADAPTTPRGGSRAVAAATAPPPAAARGGNWASRAFAALTGGGAANPNNAPTSSSRRRMTRNERVAGGAVALALFALGGASAAVFALSAVRMSDVRMPFFAGARADMLSLRVQRVVLFAAEAGMLGQELNDYVAAAAAANATAAAAIAAAAAPDATPDAAAAAALATEGARLAALQSPQGSKALARLRKAQEDLGKRAEELRADYNAFLYGRSADGPGENGVDTGLSIARPGEQVEPALWVDDKFAGIFFNGYYELGPEHPCTRTQVELWVEECPAVHDPIWKVRERESRGGGREREPCAPRAHAFFRSKARAAKQTRAPHAFDCAPTRPLDQTNP
jgi:hypothetical protein